MCQIYTDSSFLKLPVDAVVTLKLETKFIQNTHRFYEEDTICLVFYVASVDTRNY